MKQKININTLNSWATPIREILKGIADFNIRQVGCTIDSYEYYIKRYNSLLPSGLREYKTNKPDENTLEIYANEVLLLSITMCEVYELEENNITINENY